MVDPCVLFDLGDEPLGLEQLPQALRVAAVHGHRHLWEESRRAEGGRVGAVESAAAELLIRAQTRFARTARATSTGAAVSGSVGAPSASDAAAVAAPPAAAPNCGVGGGGDGLGVGIDGRAAKLTPATVTSKLRNHNGSICGGRTGFLGGRANI